MFGSYTANSVCNVSYSHQYASSNEADDRQNVSCLSIDMSADDRTTTRGRHIDQHNVQLSVDILTDAWSICWSICRPTHLGHRSTLDQYATYWLSVDRYVSQHSADMSTDTSLECWSICWLIYRLRGAQNTHDPAWLPAAVWESGRNRAYPEWDTTTAPSSSSPFPGTDLVTNSWAVLCI